MLRSTAPAFRRLIVIVTFCCLYGVGVFAQRGNPTVACLDTMVLKARTVFVGRLVEASSYRQGTEANVVFAVEKRLRGNVSDRTAVKLRASDAALAAWKTEGHRLLIAVPGDGVVPADGLSEGYESAIDLSAPNLTVLRADMTILQSADAVVAAAEEAIRTHSGADGVNTFKRTIPIASALMLRPVEGCGLDEKWSLHCLVTLVPVDEHLERWALAAIQSPYAWERAEAASALQNFPSDDNIAVLKTCGKTRKRTGSNATRYRSGRAALCKATQCATRVEAAQLSAFARPGGTRAALSVSRSLNSVRPYRTSAIDSDNIPGGHAHPGAPVFPQDSINLSRARGGRIATSGKCQPGGRSSGLSSSGMGLML